MNIHLEIHQVLSILCITSGLIITAILIAYEKGKQDGAE